jgi:hypothetical protein
LDGCPIFSLDTCPIRLDAVCVRHPLIQQQTSRRISHLEDFVIGQVFNFFGQMTSLSRSARAVASARLETPSLDKTLLT